MSGAVMLPPPERCLGHAGRGLAHAARLRPPTWHRKPQGSPGNHAAARLRTQTKRLAVKVSTRDIAPGSAIRAVVLLDQLKEIYIDAELEPIDTTPVVSPRSNRKDYTVALKPDRQTASTSRTRISTRTTCAGAGRELQHNTVIPSSTKWSTGNRWRPIRKSARRWFGKSSGKLAEDGATAHHLLRPRGGVAGSPM